MLEFTTDTVCAVTKTRIGPQGKPALAPAMCPVPVLCRFPDRRLGLSWPLSVIRPPERSAQRRRRTSTALPARALFITRGAFRRLIAAGAPTV